MSDMDDFTGGSKRNQFGVIISDAVLRVIRLMLWAVNVLLWITIVFSRILTRTLRTLMLFAPQMVSKILPKRTQGNLDQQLVFAGVDMTSDEVLGFTFVYSVVITIATYLITTYLELSKFAILIATSTAFVGVLAAPLVIISLLISKRVGSVEQMLPDILSIVSQNMAAGMTTYNALWSAARPEFGPCAEELQLAAKDTLTGTPLTDALYQITQRVKSDRLARSIRLIIQGINSGGDLPEVLESISNDMRNEFSLREQMAAETNAQSLFIVFATVVGAPLLLSVSHQFVSIFSTLMLKLDIDELSRNLPDQATMFSLSALTITPAFFQKYAIVLLIVSGTFGSLLVGLLRTGDPINGVPNILILVIAAVLVFLGIKYALSTVFGSMLV